MMRSAFTLIELLMVVAIMGILGTVTVGGYRAMQRGMEERGVMENVNHFIRAAYRRAKIDRQPTAVFYWNETLREESADGTETIIVVGKAVAVRRAGRVSRYKDPFIFDEFGDLDKERLIVDAYDEDNDNADSGSVEDENLVPIYKMTSKGSSGRALASQTTVNKTAENVERMLSRMEDVKIPCYAYRVEDKGSAGTWKPGDAYGFEFAEIQLPHNYIFGSDYNRSTRAPVTIGTPIWFDVGDSASVNLEINSLRQSGSGEFKPEKVGKVGNPSEEIH